MTYNYLWLVNRLCEKMNEVPLTSSTFASADGVYSDFKSSVNSAISDVYQDEDSEWPFSWQEKSFTTDIGDNSYTPDATLLNLDWDSFCIKKAPITISSLTQISGVATAVTLVNNQCVTGDVIYVYGANETDYVGSFAVTVVDDNTFTFTVASTATTPATGTIKYYPAYSTKKLIQIDYDSYREERFLEQDDNQIMTGQYSPPIRIVRKPDNTFLLSPKPDRVYTVVYDGFAVDIDLVDYDDVPLVPEVWKETIVKGATYYAYLFRDNIEEAAIQEDRFTKALNRMRRLLIPQTYYMRIAN